MSNKEAIKEILKALDKTDYAYPFLNARYTLKEAIDKNKFEEAYDILRMWYGDYTLANDFTKMLMDCEINPLEHMTKTAMYMFTDYDIGNWLKNISFPSSIKVLNSNTVVHMSDLTNIMIPSELIRYNPDSICNCKNLDLESGNEY